MAKPGEDVDFNFSFDDEVSEAKQPGGASGHAGGVAPPPPDDMHDEFDALPDSPTGVFGGGGGGEHHDSFGDIGADAPVAYSAEEDGPEALRRYEETDPAGFAGADSGETVDQFDAGEEAVDFTTEDQSLGDDHSSIEEDERVLRHDSDAEEDHGLETAPAVASRSLLSRMIMPVGGVALLAGVGYFAWSYVSPMFFGAPAVQTAQVPQKIQMPPTSTLPPAGAPAAQRPPMPAQTPGQARPAPVQQPAPAPLPPLGSAAPGSQARSPAMGQPVSPVVPAPSPVQADAMTGMNRPPADDALRAISGQLESIGVSVGRVNSRLDVLERAAQADRSDFSGRIAALESGRLSHAGAKPAASPTAVEARPAPQPKAPSLASDPKPSKAVAKARAEASDDEEAPKTRRSHLRRSAALQRPVARAETDEATEAGDVAYAGDEPPAKPVRLTGVRLKAVSEINGRSIVSVQTSRGRTEEFTIGQTIPGAGEIRSIRQNGGSWVVVTSRGVIVE